MKISNCLLVASILFYSAFSINAAVGEGISPVGMLSSQIFAKVDSLTVGPSIKEIKVPTNGKGYIYFSFTSDEEPVFVEDDFFVSLKNSESQFYTSADVYFKQSFVNIIINKGGFL